MHVIHNVESDNFYDSLTFYTTDEAEIATLKELAIKIFGQSDVYVCKKPELGACILMFDFINNIPDENTVLYIVNTQDMGTKTKSNIVPANPYDIKFLVDKKVAEEVHETTNNNRIQEIAEMIINDELKINPETFQEYKSICNYPEREDDEYIKTGTTLCE
jgi:hypothetical protein